MKTGLSTQLGQQLHLTPQLLQLDGLQLEMEVQRALDLNPLLEVEEAQDAEQNGEIEVLPAQDAAATEVAAFDELPESNLWDVPGTSWQDGDDDRMQRVAAGESSDPHVRVLDRLALELDERALDVVAFWLENTNDAGYLEQAPETLALLASARFDLSTGAVLALRDRLLRGEFPGLTAADVRECLLVQLDCLHGRVPGRHVARRIVTDGLALLAAHEYDARPGLLHDRVVDWLLQLRQQLVKAIGMCIDTGELSAKTDPVLLAFELFAVAQGLHDARLYDAEQAPLLARRSLDRLLASYGAPAVSTPA